MKWLLGFKSQNDTAAKNFSFQVKHSALSKTYFMLRTILDRMSIAIEGGFDQTLSSTELVQRCPRQREGKIHRYIVRIDIGAQGHAVGDEVRGLPDRLRGLSGHADYQLDNGVVVAL